jgi:hypothetical protein
LSVARTFAHLVYEIARFKPIPRKLIEESRERVSYPPHGIIERPSS